MGAKGRLTRFLAGLLCLRMVFSLTGGVFGGVRALAAEGQPELSPTGPEANEAPATNFGIKPTNLGIRPVFG